MERSPTTCENFPLLATWDSGVKVRSVSISPDNNRIVFGCDDHTVRIWDVQTEVLALKPLKGHVGVVRSVAFSSDGAHLVSGSEDCCILIWDAQDGTRLSNPLKAHTASVEVVAFSPDKIQVASGSSDNTACVWDAHTGVCEHRRLEGHIRRVSSLAFSSDGNFLVSGSFDCTIRIWDAYSGALLIGPLEGHSGCVRSLSISPDGAFIASASFDRTVRNWDVRTGRELFEPLMGPTDMLHSVTFSPNGTHLMVGSAGFTVHTWDAKSGAAVAEPIQFCDGILDTMAFSPNCTRLVSVSSNSVIQLWNMQRETQPLFRASSPDSIQSTESYEMVTHELCTDETVNKGSPSASMANTLEHTTRSSSHISCRMSAHEMFLSLLDHGCDDLSSSMNPDKYSSVAIAGGGFGDIWEGRMQDGSKVAIKCLRFHAMPPENKPGLKRAARELYVWSKAKHVNVQELSGIIMFQGRLGMVSPWMDNGNLQEYLQKSPNADRYHFCVQIALGVSYLHSINMVHGDIKAINVLVSKEGIAKLNDFDHSILMDPTLCFSSTSNVGGGTLRWMAPELILGPEDESSPPTSKTTQTDVYALGMTMLEIISGRVPYAEYVFDRSIMNAVYKKKPPNRPAELTGNERADQMWALLGRCWDYDPAVRPSAPSVLQSVRF